MLKYQSNNFFKSAMYALNGIRLAFKSQRNFRKHILIAICAFIICFLFKLDILSFCIVIVSYAITICMELINSCIEFILDAYYKNKWAKLAKLAKDMGASAVLIMSCVSCFITFLLCLKSYLSL